MNCLRKKIQKQSMQQFYTCNHSLNVAFHESITLYTFLSSFAPRGRSLAVFWGRKKEKTDERFWRLAVRSKESMMMLL
jgi:hypothetical protein